MKFLLAKYQPPHLRGNNFFGSSELDPAQAVWQVRIAHEFVTKYLSIAQPKARAAQGQTGKVAIRAVGRVNPMELSCEIRVINTVKICAFVKVKSDRQTYLFEFLSNRRATKAALIFCPLPTNSRARRQKTRPRLQATPPVYERHRKHDQHLSLQPD